MIKFTLLSYFQKACVSCAMHRHLAKEVKWDRNLAHVLCLQAAHPHVR